MISVFKTGSFVTYQKIHEYNSPSTNLGDFDDSPNGNLLIKRATWKLLFLPFLWLGSICAAFLLGRMLTNETNGTNHCRESDLAWGEYPSREPTVHVYSN